MESRTWKAESCTARKQRRIDTSYFGQEVKRYNEELNDTYSSPNIVRVIKSRRLSWAGHVARMGEEKGGV